MEKPIFVEIDELRRYREVLKDVRVPFIYGTMLRPGSGPPPMPTDLDIRWRQIEERLAWLKLEAYGVLTRLVSNLPSCGLCDERALLRAGGEFLCEEHARLETGAQRVPWYEEMKRLCG